MRNISVSELRQNLAAHLALVQRGERVCITSRGRVIAELTPPAAAPDRVVAARARLRGSVRRYDHPLEPSIETSGWDLNR